ncbi:MAG: DUF1330 domain-containing protein [Minwuiales bacterium]|nr:DUF1330 domain-containing protein [Minwuiales bacterium]
MPPAYIIVQVDVHDEEKYEEYRKLVPPTIAKYGGEYLVRGGRFEKLEGDEPYPRIVVLKFESMEQAKAWYHSEDYAGPMAIRHSASVANSILVEGFE